MDVKPVTRYGTPKYPTRDYLAEHPELLRWVPKRWRKNRLVLATLSAVAVLIFSAQSRAQDVPDRSHAESLVAPVFAHGGGRGVFGCRAVNPPVFLSEEEAFQVIQDEARKAGLDFDSCCLTIQKSWIPETPWAVSTPGVERENILEAAQEKTLELDGFDRECQVGFEYVSFADHKSWSIGSTRGHGSVWEELIKETAERFQLEVAKTSPGIVLGVFYDPVIGTREWLKSLTENEKQSRYQYYKTDQQSPDTPRPVIRNRPAEEQLRAQVRDFIEWLISEGII